MGAVGELMRRIVEQLQVRFVYQRGGLQGMIGPLVAQMPLGDAVQFGINQFRQLVEGVRVPSPQLLEKKRDSLHRLDPVYICPAC